MRDIFSKKWVMGGFFFFLFTISILFPCDARLLCSGGKLSVCSTPKGCTGGTCAQTPNSVVCSCGDITIENFCPVV